MALCPRSLYNIPSSLPAQANPAARTVGKTIKASLAMQRVRAHCFQNWREPYVSKGTRLASPTSLHSVSCASAVPAP